MASRPVKAGPFCKHGVSVTFPCRKCGKRARPEFKGSISIFIFLVIIAGALIAVLETKG